MPGITSRTSARSKGDILLVAGLGLQEPVLHRGQVGRPLRVLRHGGSYTDYRVVFGPVCPYRDASSGLRAFVKSDLVARNPALRTAWRVTHERLHYALQKRSG